MTAISTPTAVLPAHAGPQACHTSYRSIAQVLDSAEAPALLDSLDFTYRGVQVHVYGTLHAVTGGTNRAYVEAVNRTIAQAPGLLLCEQGMPQMYRGLDNELQDWIQIPARDAFLIAANLVFPPPRLAMLVRTILKEKLTQQDRFGADGVRRLQDIGGALAFHLLRPSERRRLAGFPDAPTYLTQNLLRRRGQSKLASPAFPDKDWTWLVHVERFINIPCRSIHMVEYATEMALLKGLPEVSVFVGEVHNSDMHWYQSLGEQDAPGFPDWALAEIAGIRTLARQHARAVLDGRRTWRRAACLGAMSLGALLPMLAYAGAGLATLAFLTR